MKIPKCKSSNIKYAKTVFIEIIFLSLFHIIRYIFKDILYRCSSTI